MLRADGLAGSLTTCSDRHDVRAKNINLNRLTHLLTRAESARQTRALVESAWQRIAEAKTGLSARSLWERVTVWRGARNCESYYSSIATTTTCRTAIARLLVRPRSASMPASARAFLPSRWNRPCTLLGLRPSGPAGFAAGATDRAGRQWSARRLR